MLALVFGWWAVGHLVDDEAVDDAALHEKPEQVAPPLLARPPHWVVAAVLVVQVDPTHVLIV